jgi:hypothetical protein
MASPSSREPHWCVAFYSAGLCHRNAIDVTSRPFAVSPFLARPLRQARPYRHRHRCDRRSRGQAVALPIMRPSPALRAGDHRPRAASTERAQGKSKPLCSLCQTWRLCGYPHEPSRHLASVNRPLTKPAHRHPGLGFVWSRSASDDGSGRWSGGVDDHCSLRCA